ncbi:MAG: Na+/H+ antiporter subunit E [Betaproteobacteria bacterium]|nr:MAG: Na+/H+ antiporter subunit E [Betaproteobacteria bacterium]
MDAPARPGASRDSRRGWLPHPAISIVLVCFWLLLQNEFSLGHLLLGLALGLLVPRLTAGLWPMPPRIRSYRKAGAYLLLVLWDIAIANVTVARLVLFRRSSRLRMRWVVVPLELVAPEAIAVFAATITLTPGTVSCDLSADGRCLLVHCLDAGDADAAARAMKDRYEVRLKEIFG